jgi:hypothetical protein
MISDRTKPDSGATDALRELSERIAAVDTALAWIIHEVSSQNSKDALKG